MRPARTGVWLSAVALSLGLVAFELWRQPAALAPAQAAWPQAAVPESGLLILKSAGRIPMPENTPAAHASTLLALPADHPAVLQAYWFAGTRESGADVQILSSEFERASQQWKSCRTTMVICVTLDTRSAKAQACSGMTLAMPL